MAFIEKKDPIVLNIMITSKGRDLLSQGKLSFDYYGIGDSEIDYNYVKETGFDPFNSNILRAVDKNPEIISFITQNLTGDTLNAINSVPNLGLSVENHVNPIGFFNPTATEFLTDGAHVKQPDIMIEKSDVVGGNILHIKQSPDYLGNVNEPEKGDILMIKWANPQMPISTTGYTIISNVPSPYIFYNIVDVVSGSLANNDLIVEIDRDIPDFTGIAGNDNASGGIVFYNKINYTGDTGGGECETSTTSTDATDDALIAFMQNCQCPTIRFPFWNLSIIFTENIPGVQELQKKYYEYNTNTLAGFVSYIQNQQPKYKKLGVIHYTNNSVANTYAEEFFGDPNNIDDAAKIPTLDIPYIMWHKSSGTTMGVHLKAFGELKYLTGETRSLNTRYYDLADNDGNVVGKVFYDLKIFVIEDQELLFALSYKSNRSWTLPDYDAKLNVSVTIGCAECTLTYDIVPQNPSAIGSSDGSITITNITGNLGYFEQGQILLEVLNDGTQIFFNSIDGETTIDGLSTGDYLVKLYDIVAANCIVTGTTTLTDPTSSLSVVSVGTTASRLIANIPIIQVLSNSLNININTNDVVNNSGFYGEGYITMVKNNIDPDTRVNTTTDSTKDIYSSGYWVKLPYNGSVSTNSLANGENYIIYVRDITPNDTDIHSASTGQTLTYYNT